MTDAAPKTCFIAMPVSTSKEHAEKFGDTEHWKHVLETLFVPAVEKAGFTPVRPTAKGSHMIHAQIVQHLSTADLVLVDMSQDNPNVFFELGVRTSVNKPIALVRCDAGARIPFDVSGINTHTYDPSLKAWHIEQEIENLADHLREAESSCAGENPMWKQFGLELTASEPTTSGVSKEEAMLEVLTRQVTELTRKVDPPRGPRNDSGGWRRDNVGEAIPPISDQDFADAEVATLHEIVGELAERYDLRYDIDQTTEGEPLVVLFNTTPQAARQFSAALAKDANSLGIKYQIGYTEP